LFLFCTKIRRSGSEDGTKRPSGEALGGKKNPAENGWEW